jgi:two-component response regulator (ARR-B family)
MILIYTLYKLIYISALCWSIWTCQNNIIFYNQKGTNFLQVIRLATHWIELWSLLLPEDQGEPMVTGCNRLRTVAQDFYFQATGWRHISRLDG